MSMDFMGNCRRSAPHITLTPREPGRPAALAVWCLPSRTAWSPHPRARLALTFSTEPSQLTQALQCMICLQAPQASSGSLFEVGLKTPRSCRSALWTAVLASSPLSTLKARSSPGFCFCWHPEPFCCLPFVSILRPHEKGCQPKQQDPPSRQWVFGRQDWVAGALQECSQLLRFLSGFPADQQDCLFKGNLESHSTEYLLLLGC